MIPDFYRDNIKVAALLAPVAGMAGITNPLLLLMSIKVNRDLLTSILESVKLYSLLPNDFIYTP